MGDKDAIKAMQERLQRTLAWRQRVQEEAALAVKEKEKREGREHA